MCWCMYICVDMYMCMNMIFYVYPYVHTLYVLYDYVLCMRCGDTVSVKLHYIN